MTINCNRLDTYFDIEDGINYFPGNNFDNYDLTGYIVKL